MNTTEFPGGTKVTAIALGVHGPLAQLVTGPAGPRLLLSDMASTDEGAHAPAQSLQVYGPQGLQALRDALLQAWPVFSMEAHLQRQAEFSARTFGPGKRVAGVCDHIRKELVEVEASDGDLSEWVDVIILGLDGAWRSGATPAQILAAIVAKQEKNEGRTWPDWRTAAPGAAIEHDRSTD